MFPCGLERGRSGRSATDWLVENKSDPVVGLSWTNFDSLRGRSAVAREGTAPERIAVPRPPPLNGAGTVHRPRVARVTPAALTVDRWSISRYVGNVAVERCDANTIDSYSNGKVYEIALAG